MFGYAFIINSKGCGLKEEFLKLASTFCTIFTFSARGVAIHDRIYLQFTVLCNNPFNRMEEKVPYN